MPRLTKAGCVALVMTAALAWAGAKSFVSCGSDLRFSCLAQNHVISTGEPIVVTLSLRNMTGRRMYVPLSSPANLLETGDLCVALTDAVGRAYSYRTGISSQEWWPSDHCYPLPAGDSVYWRLLLWWDNFKSRATPSGLALGACTLRFVFRVPRLTSEGFMANTGEALAWTDSLVIRLVPSRDDVPCAATCSRFLKEWFWMNGKFIPGSKNGGKLAHPAARTDSFLRAFNGYRPSLDSTCPHMGFVLPQAESYTPGWRERAISDAKRFVSGHGGHPLAEELSIEMVRFYERDNLLALADAQLGKVLSLYPRNARCLNYEKGRESWRKR